jgi:glycosyltransferase involved in cell wall biosynthesis
LKVSVVINNYNYSNYIEECVDSVLNQTYKDIELIIIDDGSTDNSIYLLKSKYGEDKFILVNKKNAGQLSAFNESLKYITGEVIFQLDSDDRYKKNYIEEIVKIYKKNKHIDFIFCEMEKFFLDGTKEVKINKKHLPDHEVGFSVLSTLYAQEWIGSPTSALSLRRSLYEEILPVPLEKDWITRADDCLIYGGSILGANKYYCSKALVEYRIHGSNAFFNKNFSLNDKYIRKIRLNKLVNFFYEKSKLNINLSDLILPEFLTRNHSNIRILKFYFKVISKMNLNIFSQIIMKLKIIMYFFKANIFTKTK